MNLIIFIRSDMLHISNLVPIYKYKFKKNTIVKITIIRVHDTDIYSMIV